MSAPSGHSGSGAIIAALGANLGIAVLKFLAFALTRSSSMLAEAIHSVADSGNQLLLLLGGRASQKQADESDPFGYGRNAIFTRLLFRLLSLPWVACSLCMRVMRSCMTRTVY